MLILSVSVGTSAHCLLHVLKTVCNEWTSCFSENILMQCHILRIFSHNFSDIIVKDCFACFQLYSISPTQREHRLDQPPPLLDDSCSKCKTSRQFYSFLDWNSLYDAMVAPKEDISPGRRCSLWFYAGLTKAWTTFPLININNRLFLLEANSYFIITQKTSRCSIWMYYSLSEADPGPDPIFFCCGGYLW